MNATKILVLAGVGMLGAVLPQVKADVWNQQTQFTFSGPVEVPGRVLPAGTYVFKLLDSQSDRNIVQIFNKDQTHLYATFPTVADYRLTPAGKTVLTFEERAADSPEAVRAWFYPGENYGHQFVYPKVKALALAKANNVPVPSMPQEMAQNTTQPASTAKAPSVTAMQQAPLKAQKPDQQEVELAEVFVAPPASAPAPAQSAPTTVAQNRPSRLPKTASPLPLIGLMGLLSLFAAASLRLAAVKVR
jgi:hypothetical protein